MNLPTEGASRLEGKPPKVSIIVTAYNRGACLSSTLDSLLSQTFGDFELLLCDDVSADETEAVGRDYAARDSRVVYHRNVRNLGMPGNLNEGIRRCKGTFIANLHDGDTFEPDLINKWKRALEQYPTAAFVFNQYRALKKGGETAAVHSESLPPVFPGDQLLEEIFFRRWLFDSPVWGTVMARKTAYLGAGLFDPRFGCVADIDMWMRLAENHAVAYIQEPLIRLAPRETVPGNFVIPTNLVRRIYWESRLRHYRGRTLRLAAEVGRHAAYSLASRTYFGACSLKAAALKALRP